MKIIVALGQLPWGKSPLDDCPPDNSPLSGKLQPRKIAPPAIKFLTKIIACTKVNFSKEYYEWTEEQYSWLTSSIIKTQGEKSDLLSLFFKDFSHICRTHLVREHFSVNASGFSYTKTQQFLAENSQLIYLENFRVHNHNKKKSHMVCLLNGQFACP